MNLKLGKAFAVVCAFAMCAVCAVPACAQSQEVKEKPRMYTYIAFWTIARPQWADEEKLVASEQKLMEKGISDGQLVGYGDDKTLVHTIDGPTHDTWFSAMSMAGLFNVLDGIYKSGMPTGPVQAGASKHWDNVVVSRYYNWHPGSWKEVYSVVAAYKLKADAPNDAVETLSKNFIVPVMEKLLADGTIHEYEVDTEAIHTDNPADFWIAYIVANAEGLDKVQAAVREAVRSNPLSGPGFGSIVDFNEHRDSLVRTNATYK